MLKQIGDVVQIAYVVEDLDESIAHWNRLGAGPFFVLRKITYAKHIYRGEHTDCEISAAFGYLGNIQIELMKPLNDAPSTLKDFKDTQGTGVQHLGVLSKNLSQDIATLESSGLKVVQHMVATTGATTVLLDTDDNHGSVVELIEETPELVEAFATMQEAAANWDPSKPGLIEVQG